MVGSCESATNECTEGSTGTAETATTTDHRRRVATRNRLAMVGVAAAAIAIDFASKVWASAQLPGDPISLGPLTLRLVHNRGVAFGVGGFLSATTIVVVTAAIAILVAVFGWSGRLYSPIGAGLIVGGAVANVADRLTAGSVVDFIDIGRWPVFNLADVVLLTGIALIACASRNSSPTDAPLPKSGA